MSLHLMASLHNNLIRIYVLHLLWSVQISCKQKLKTHPRILGGKACNLNKYPYIVSVISPGLCGGSLITLEWVLTAAHCLDLTYINNRKTFLRAGFTTNNIYIQKRRAKKGVIHEKYLRAGIFRIVPDLRYDIALVLTEQPFIWTEFVGVAKLPHLGFSKKCNVATAVGIGLTIYPSEDKIKDLLKRPLMCVDLNIINKSQCRNMYRAIIDDTVVCTMEKSGGKDACSGDSGGPLVCDNVVIAIISTGVECGLPNQVAFYTKVESFLDFIKEGIKSSSIMVKSIENLAITSVFIQFIIL